MNQPSHKKMVRDAAHSLAHALNLDYLGDVYDGRSVGEKYVVANVSTNGPMSIGIYFYPAKITEKQWQAIVYKSVGSEVFTRVYGGSPTSVVDHVVAYMVMEA